MAEPTYVQIAPIKVKAADSKQQTAVAGQIKEAFEDKIKSSGFLTTAPPKKKDAKGFSLTINFTLTATSKGIDGKMNLAFAYWPKLAIFGSAQNNASGTDPKDVDGVVEAILGSIVPKVLAQLKSQIPKLADA